MRLYKENVEIKTKDGGIITRNIYKQTVKIDNIGGLKMATIKLAVRYNNEIWEVRGVFGNGEPHLYRNGV